MIKQLVYAALATVGLTGVAAACPDYTQYGQTYNLTGDQLYAEQRYRITAGGSIDIQRCGNVRPQTDRGPGYVITAPDFSFNLSGMGRYRLVITALAASSGCDPILLVNTGSAAWYYDDDDGGGVNARISLTQPRNGWLDVWVGTYDGSYCEAILSMETFNR